MSAARTGAVLVALLVSGLAHAHAVGLSRGEYRLDGESVHATLVFARPELAGLMPELDGDSDGTLSEAEVSAGGARLAERVLRGISVRADGAACSASPRGARLTEQDGVQVEGDFACGRAPSKVAVEFALAGDLSHGHRHMATLRVGATPAEAALFRGNALLEATASGATGSAVASLFGMGVLHILTGYDHLVFLLGLVLVGGRKRALLGVVTAFTVAHSITLGMAALDIWAPSPRFVEPAIALSIAYVGVENFFVRDAERRWRLTFPFGLVHGFGFAGALREVALPRGQVVPALLSFNLGVEAGQLMVLSVVLPLLLWARRRDWFVGAGVKATSGAIVAAGVSWTVLRVLG